MRSNNINTVLSIGDVVLVTESCCIGSSGAWILTYSVASYSGRKGGCFVPSEGELFDMASCRFS